MPGGPTGGQSPSDPLGTLVKAASATVDGSAKLVNPEVDAAVAKTTFGFPLGLALAVILFLVVQNWLDYRHPNLRAAPLSGTDALLPTEREGEQQA